MPSHKLHRYCDCDYLAKGQISDLGSVYTRLDIVRGLLAAASMLRHETSLGSSKDSAGHIAYRRLIGAAVYILEEEPVLDQFAKVVRRLLKFKNDTSDEFDWLMNQMKLIENWTTTTGPRRTSMSRLGRGDMPATGKL